MSEQKEKFGKQLDVLIAKGEKLLWAMQYECFPEDFEDFEDSMTESLGGDNGAAKAAIAKLPKFGDDYQAWYSEAQAVIKQVMPDRLADFVSYFEIPKGRKDISFQNYVVRDYLQGLGVQRDGKYIVKRDAAIPEFTQQLNLVKAASAVLESSLMDIKAVLQADLFDSEIDSAKALAKAGWLRAAGAICGVVLEKHLHHVCDFHNIKVTKKNPGIADLSQLLRDANITTVPQWRYIQSLADIRNICDHAKGREPTKEEIEDLTTGTDKVLKQVF